MSFTKSFEGISESMTYLLRSYKHVLKEYRITLLYSRRPTDLSPKGGRDAVRWWDVSGKDFTSLNTHTVSTL